MARILCVHAFLFDVFLKCTVQTHVVYPQVCFDVYMHVHVPCTLVPLQSACTCIDTNTVCTYMYMCTCLRNFDYMCVSGIILSNILRHLR